MVETLRDIDLVRAVADVPELRATDAALPTLKIRFSPFGKWYRITSMFEGDFMERTAAGAFAKTISENRANMKVLFDHGMDPSIGNKVIGPIDLLEEKSAGPYAEVPMLDTSYNRDLLPGIEAGVYGSSFRFRVVKDEWNDEPGRSKSNPDGVPERTIKEVRLFEFGPVAFPANPAATAGVRSMTDEYYDSLRARDPQQYDELRSRAQALHQRSGAAVGTPVLAGAAPQGNDEPAHATPRVTPQERRRRAAEIRGVI